MFSLVEINKKLAILKYPVLYNHYFYVSPNIFVAPKKILYPLSSHSLFSPMLTFHQPLVTTNLLSVLWIYLL